jgi:hypothetical protein
VDRREVLYVENRQKGIIVIVDRDRHTVDRREVLYVEKRKKGIIVIVERDRHTVRGTEKCRKKTARYYPETQQIHKIEIG